MTIRAANTTDSNDTSVHPVYHYTGGKKEMDYLEIQKLKDELNKERQEHKKSYDNLTTQVKSLSKTVELS